MGLVYTALVTPFKLDGSVDLSAFEKIVDAQLEAGIHGLVVCGSTGEGMTLTDPEKEALLKTAVACVAGRVPVIMGVMMGVIMGVIMSATWAVNVVMILGIDEGGRQFAFERDRHLSWSFLVFDE